MITEYLEHQEYNTKNILTHVLCKYIKVNNYIVNPTCNFEKILLTLCILWFKMVFLYLTYVLLLKQITLLHSNHNLLLHKTTYDYEFPEMIMHNTRCLYFYKSKLCIKSYYIIEYICCRECTIKIHHYFNYHLPVEYKKAYINVISKSHNPYNIIYQTSKNA